MAKEKKELGDYKQIIADKIEQNENFIIENEKIIEQYHIRITDIKQRITKEKLEISKVNQNIEKLKFTFEKEKQHFEQVNQEIQEMRNNHSQLCQELSSINTIHSNMNDKLSKILKEISSKKEQQITNQRSLKEMAQSIQQLRQEMQDMEQKISFAEQDIALEEVLQNQANTFSKPHDISVRNMPEKTKTFNHIRTGDINSAKALQHPHFSLRDVSRARSNRSLVIESVKASQQSNGNNSKKRKEETNDAHDILDIELMKSIVIVNEKNNCIGNKSVQQSHRPFKYGRIEK
jgi:predicted  nucleic acid-binding Zn-ribbon protein